jgi:hypothetical protein
MTTAYKILGQSSPSANTTTTLYTVPSSNVAVVSTMAICNQHSANANVSIAICAANAAVALANHIVKDALITTNDTIFLTLGVTMAATDTIRVTSSTANIGFSAFGSEIY